MDLHYLWLFYKVAKNKSFSKAAEELTLSQPTISMQVKKLEAELGINLFDRFGKNIYLSRDGEFVYSYAEKIFETVKELEDHIAAQKGKIIGNVHIGASNTPGVHILPNLLGVFKKNYPDITTHLHIRNTQDILNMIITNQVDFAIVGGKYEYKKTLKTKKLFDDSIILIGSPENSLTQKDSILPEELIEQPFITHEVNSNLYYAAEDIIKNDLKVPFKTSMTLGNITAINNAVAANLGISLVPFTSAKHHLEKGMVKKISVENKIWTYPFYIVYYRDKILNLPTKLLIKTIGEKINDFI
ncbi:LysR family transcriptional regulator [Clostridium swellfunianum]|uniref:LysR family transcriptional regulator n=1 Tax=Clostridium swellfunianum TaxID=1367462 RepID=UPI00202ECF32|nr:LysR family transcriptional regulator [Clostridium swellfunianum]MCM0650939.1 LysR family transcriptional regulator [Clostridium swellfunianum]